jgi:hypothetical protein
MQVSSKQGDVIHRPLEHKVALRTIISNPRDDKFIKVLSDNIQEASSQVLQLCEELAGNIVHGGQSGQSGQSGNVKVGITSGQQSNQEKIDHKDVFTDTETREQLRKVIEVNEGAKSAQVTSHDGARMTAASHSVVPFCIQAPGGIVASASRSFSGHPTQPKGHRLEKRGRRPAGPKAGSGGQPSRSLRAKTGEGLTDYMQQLDTVGHRALTPHISVTLHNFAHPQYSQEHTLKFLPGREIKWQIGLSTPSLPPLSFPVSLYLCLPLPRPRLFLPPCIPFSLSPSPSRSESVSRAPAERIPRQIILLRIDFRLHISILVYLAASR